MFQEIQKEAGVYSANRVVPINLIIVHTLIYVLVLIYVLFLYKGAGEWPYFRDITGTYLGILTTCSIWLSGNKFINSKYNTEQTSVGKPMNKNVNTINK